MLVPIRMGIKWRPETNRNSRHWVLLRKRELPLEELKNIKIIIFFNTWTVQISKFPKKVTFLKSTWQLSRQKFKRSLSQKQKPIRSENLYMNITFQLLLYIMKVNSQDDEQFCNLNSSDVVWKPGIQRSQVTHLIWLPYQCHLVAGVLGGRRQTHQ